MRETKHLFQADTYREVCDRIEALTPDAQPVWGRMTVGQMLAHCVEAMRNALGETAQKRQWIGYLIGPLLRASYLSARPFRSKQVRTPFPVTETKVFATEKARLLQHLQRLHGQGASLCQGAYHPIFGELTPEEWALAQYKHLDHHLRQFGV